MWDNLCYSLGICWITTILLTIYLAWATVFYLSSVKSCCWKKKIKKQWKSWNSGRDLTKAPQEQGKSWTIQSNLKKSSAIETCPFTLWLLTIDLTMLSQEKIQSLFLSLEFSPLVPSFIPSTVNWRRFYLHRHPWGGCFLATLQLFCKHCVLEQRLTHTSYKDSKNFRLLGHMICIATIQFWKQKTFNFERDYKQMSVAGSNIHFGSWAVVCQLLF